MLRPARRGEIMNTQPIHIMNSAPAACGDVKDSDPAAVAAPDPGLLPDFAPIEPWPEAVPGDRLLDDLLTLLSRFVVFPEWAAETFALWIVHPQCQAWPALGRAPQRPGH